jgi:hypothetical protein
MKKEVKFNKFKIMKRENKNKLKISYVSLYMMSCALFFMALGCGTNNDNEEPIPWAVKLKLKPQTDESYLPTEDPVIKALLSKHGVTMRQTMPPGPRSTPELLSYYTLTGSSNMSKESREHCIADFLATGKFEDEVFEYGIAHTG